MRQVYLARFARDRSATSSSSGSEEPFPGPVGFMDPIEFFPRYRTRSNTTLAYDE